MGGERTPFWVSRDPARSFGAVHCLAWARQLLDQSSPPSKLLMRAFVLRPDVIRHC